MQNKGLKCHITLCSSLPVSCHSGGGSQKRNNVGVKHTQRHPNSCFFSLFLVFCFFFGLLCACMCWCEHMHIYMSALSQGSICWKRALAVEEGRAEDFRRKGNPGDNVEYFILPIAPLLRSVLPLFEPLWFLVSD